MNNKTRTVRDSMGELTVAHTAFYSAQTQRAVNNFPISGLRMPKAFIRALGLIKAAAAKANAELGTLDANKADAIVKAAQKVASGQLNEHFPVDVFQTGSGTSSNMNANEVIAFVASQESKLTIHPNDDVNNGQSSNDVIPTAIHVASALLVHEQLLPALQSLYKGLQVKASEVANITKTGRTHLMDAMPITLSQEINGWAAQINSNIARFKATLPRIQMLAQGGTAVGTGINAHRQFGELFAQKLASDTGIDFVKNSNYFESISTQDTAVELSGQCRTLAVSLMKIANDLRWMNSGPLAGLGEIALPALQPGSSIMPGKVNPVIPEAVCMVAAQVMGNDATIAVGGQAGNFQLNVMLPVIAYNLCQSIEILANACTMLYHSAIKDFTVNQESITATLDKNPILVTALNAVIGYEKGAAIAKVAYKEKRPILEVAQEMTNLSTKELKNLLDPTTLTEAGIPQK